MSICVEHITKTYGKQFAVNDVSFSIPKGETCGFLGPNGAGKSTTLKIITGFLQADSGSVSIEDIDVNNHPIEAKQQIGYLAEHNPLYPEMYVKEFLRFMAKTHQVQNIRTQIDRTIEQTGLEREAHKTIGQLSKGYRQRVGLAQALIHNPAVLILDEPLSGLDPNQLAELRTLIRELGQEKTLIFSSHILQEVEQVANRILMIKEGKIVLDQKQEQHTPASAYTLIKFGEALSEEQVQHLNELGTIEFKNGMYHLLGSSDEQRKSIYQFAVRHQLTLLKLEHRKQELTTIFQQKTGSQ